MKAGRLLAAVFMGLFCLVGIAALLGAVQRERALTAKAVMAQRVRPSTEAALFGDIGENIGSPAMYVIEDPQMLLDHKGPGGLALIDESYLEKTGKYPLQLKTVNYVAQIVKIVGGIGALLFGALGLFLLRKRPTVANGTIVG